jgi:predicted PurR-regulated permease PerM
MLDVRQTSPVQTVAKKGMSAGAKVGIGIGIGCCIIILIGLVLGLIFGWNVSNVFKRQQTYITEFEQ